MYKLSQSAINVAILFPSGGFIPAIVENKLGDLQKIIGGNIELIQLSKRLILIADKDGDFKCKTVNKLATALCRKLAKKKMLICGNAVVCGCDEDGEFVNINKMVDWLTIEQINKELNK